MKITLDNPDIDITYQDCSQMKVNLKAEDEQGNLIIIRTNETKLRGALGQLRP